MPSKHSYGDHYTQLLYAPDFTSGVPVQVTCRAGALRVTDTPATGGGLLVSKLIAAASTNAAVIKSSAGQVFGLDFFNQAAYTVYVKLYNKATTPVLASDVPVMVIAIGAGQSRTIDRPCGVEFLLGIGIAATKLLANNDVTALVAEDVVGTVYYK